MNIIVVAFDLEDTLYKEMTFVKSGYQAVAEFLTISYGIDNVYLDLWKSFCSGVEDVFQKVLDEKKLTIDKAVLIDIYRFHKPRIHLDNDVRYVLEILKKKCKLAMITDGRTRTKKNIISALELFNYFKWSDVYISEEVGHLKTAPYSFEIIMAKYPDCKYIYVGDNTGKDFLMPNQLGWDSYCILDDGQHIHKQDFTLDAKYLPKHIIKSITELLNYL